MYENAWPWFANDTYGQLEESLMRCVEEHDGSPSDTALCELLDDALRVLEL